jgi:hypothetical protein
MSRDFTLKTYRALLESAIRAGYALTSYEDFIVNGHNYQKVFILRHDVDDLPNNSLQTAMLEQSLGAKGSYYFRVVKQSFDVNIIQQIKDLGHEIGYHYENMDHFNGNVDEAYKNFCKQLDRFRELSTINTVCMHGSPLSKWDNRDLWKKYSYKDLGIIGEPYFDIDFNKVFYITDTGRSWNKAESSIRDKVQSGFNFSFRSTQEIIHAFDNKQLPGQIMLNIHPQRWTDQYGLWLKEYVLQNAKNVIKRILINRRKR